MSQRFDGRTFVPIVFTLLGCGVAGILAGIQPALAVILALGITFVIVVLTNVMLGLVVFTALSFLEVTQYSSEALSFSKVTGLILFGAWLARSTTEPRRQVTYLFKSHQKIVVPALAFLVWSALSFAWAESPSGALSSTWRYLQDLLLLPIVIGTVRTRKDVIWLMVAFIVGALAAALYGFLSPQAAAGRDFGRLSATNLDANGLAAGLVVAIAFAVGLMEAARRRPVAKLLLALAIVFALIGVFATLSRSGLIALGVMLLAGLIFGGPWRPQAAILLIVAIAGTIIYFGAFASNAANQHVTSSDTAGRTTLWTVGVRMFEAHPVLGVGSGNFSVASVHYAQRPGVLTRADLIVDRPFPAHNIYLEVASDLGIVGLVAFLAIVVASISAALRAAARFRDTGRTDLELMARSLVIALAGSLASGFFQPGQYSKQLWTLIGLGPALLLIASPVAGTRGAVRSASTRMQRLEGS